jgi:hypothetical protein
MSDLSTSLDRAVQAGQLLERSARNISQLLDQSSTATAEESVTELANAGAWDELNDRFFKTLAFGTAVSADGPSGRSSPRPSAANRSRSIARSARAPARTR